MRFIIMRQHKQISSECTILSHGITNKYMVKTKKNNSIWNGIGAKNARQGIVHDYIQRVIELQIMLILNVKYHLRNFMRKSADDHHGPQHAR